MSARPFVPSAMRLDEADLKPAGSVAAAAGAADEEAEADGAEAEALETALGERSTLSFTLLKTRVRADEPPQVCLLSPEQGMGTDVEVFDSEAPFDRAEPQ